MSDTRLQLTLSLDDFRPRLEAAAAEAGITLDFLMRRWNGRFATFNVGVPVEEAVDARRGVRDEARRYRLIGRIKANTQADTLHLLLSPPTSCDPSPHPDDEARWSRFMSALHARLGDAM